ATMICIDNSEWMRNDDYSLSRFEAQARAHRLGQKKDVLVLRFETVQTVEEQVRASAEHKLAVANQSITVGFFDNNTSAEDCREYLGSLLWECKKEEVAPVWDDDAVYWRNSMHLLLLICLCFFFVEKPMMMSNGCLVLEHLV
ncbi:hypothetical protein ES332_A06G112100v1, partial [Gossypium tomentosum]